MQWDIDTLEQQIRACDYFRDHSFSFAGRNVRKPGTQFESHKLRLDNSATDRSIEITFAPPRSDGRPAISLVHLIKTSTDEKFNLQHYIKQHHSVEIGPDGFRYTNYSGDFRERVKKFVQYATELLATYAEPTLQGVEWPDVEFDWGGQK